MTEKLRGISTDVVFGLVIGLILVGLVGYNLILEDGGETGGGGEELTVKYFDTHVDQTEVLGPEGENLVEIPPGAHISHSPGEGEKISPGEEVAYSGEIQWIGGEDEDMSTYGKEKLEIHLLLTEESDTGELNAIIVVGDYSEGMGAPQTPGGEYEYVNHDTFTVQELGGSQVSAESEVVFNLSATYLKS